MKVGDLISWKYSHVSHQLKLGFRLGLSLATFYFTVYSGQKVIIIENLPVVYLVHHFQDMIYFNIYGDSLYPGEKFIYCKLKETSNIYLPTFSINNLVTGESMLSTTNIFYVTHWVKAFRYIIAINQNDILILAFKHLYSSFLPKQLS